MAVSERRISLGAKIVLLTETQKISTDILTFFRAARREMGEKRERGLSFVVEVSLSGVMCGFGAD